MDGGIPTRPTSATKARSNHTPHSPAIALFNSLFLHRKKKSVIELAEGKIGFFGYRNRTKLEAERKGGREKGFRLLFFLLLNVNGEHSYCVLPPSNSRRGKKSLRKHFLMCAEVNGLDNGKIEGGWGYFRWLRGLFEIWDKVNCLKMGVWWGRICDIWRYNETLKQ